MFFHPNKVCLGSLYYELYLLDEKIFYDLFVGKWKWILYIIRAYLFHDLYYVYVVETFITVKWETQHKSMSNPFSSLSLAFIHLFLSIHFSCMDIGILDHSHACMSFRFPMKNPPTRHRAQLHLKMYGRELNICHYRTNDEIVSRGV